MRTSTIVMIAFAVVFGLLAVFVAQSWLNNQAALRMKNLEAKKPAATSTIVVAAKPLRFGGEVSDSTLREIEWPGEAVPAGAFAKIADITKDGRRLVLAPIEENEPILASKITGPGQRATLSALIRDGLRAATVRVNDVEGVGGFVLPGDFVDVALTRQNDKMPASTDIILQNVRVLAIDQVADAKLDKPSVAKAVTLEVDTAGAQKLALAASVGTIGLVLRQAGDTDSEFTRRITTNDFTAPAVPVAKDVPANGNVTTVSVTRAATKQEYRVPVDGNWREATTGDGNAARH